MLTPDEKYKLATLKKNIKMEIGGHDSYGVTLGNISWLADRLTEVNDEANKYRTGIATLGECVAALLRK